jgi:hypothetical protein
MWLSCNIKCVRGAGLNNQTGFERYRYRNDLIEWKYGGCYRK